MHKSHQASVHNIECSCPQCEGGLSYCEVCKGAEASLPTHCPGVRMTQEQQSAVQAGDLNYLNGQWRNKVIMIASGSIVYNNYMNSPHLDETGKVIETHPKNGTVVAVVEFTDGVVEHIPVFQLEEVNENA